MNLKKILIIAILLILIINTQCFAKPKEEYTVVLNGTEEDQAAIPEDEEKKIYSEAAILMEEKTGKVLYQKNIYDKKYPASTTKILTAILAIEKCNLNELATASEFATQTVRAGYTNAGIKTGETFTIEQLLDVMMLVSANEAATIIAEHISGSTEEFAKLMNQKAQEIGCRSTHFVNANGIHDDGHYTTAYDLALIARYCIKNQKFREIISKSGCSLPTTEFCEEERNFRNSNSLLREGSTYYYPYCIGGKTGFTTPAKNCLVSFSDKDGFETIAVVMHAESTDSGLSARYTDTIKLFNYGYNNYTLQEILEEYDLTDYSKNSSGSLFSKFIKKKVSSENELVLEKEGGIKPMILIGIGAPLLILDGIFMTIKTIRKSRNRRDLYSFKY